VCSELQRENPGSGTVALSYEAGARLLATSDLIRGYREVLTDPKLIVRKSWRAAGCDATLENYAILAIQIVGPIVPEISFEPDVAYNPIGATYAALAPRSRYSSDVSVSVLVEAGQLLIPDVLAWVLLRAPAAGQHFNELCTLLMTEVQDWMRRNVRESRRCDSYTVVSVTHLVAPLVDRLSEGEKRFCATRRYIGYACLLGAMRARSLCNGEIVYRGRHYKLPLCRDLGDVAEMLTSLN
jgi:hypothetical protein